MQIKPEAGVGFFVLAALGVFFYMTFHIGVFRFDVGNYRLYTVYFKDLSGLSRKADVKIAGVKVGWVDKVSLVQGDKKMQARADIMMGKNYILRSDAHAVVRQDGLLGVKYLEIMPGDPLLPSLEKGGTLGTPGQAPTSVDELMHKFSDIAVNVEDITDSVRQALKKSGGTDQMVKTFEHIHQAATRVAAFSEILDRIASNNEDDINAIVRDIKVFAQEMRISMPQLRDDIHRVAQRLDIEVLPSFQRDVDRIATVFDRDFGRVGDKLESAADAIENAALQTGDGLRNVGSVAQKINDGKGLLGKLVNEDDTYRDLKIAVQGLKNYFSKVESLAVVFDSHFESMYRPAENFTHKDAKGYFDVRIHPGEDHFYVIQLMGSLKGSVNRTVTSRKWFDSTETEIIPSKLKLSDDHKLFFAPIVKTTVQERDTRKYGFQFGKMYQDVAFRFGMFENTFGLGVDYDIPIANHDTFRWVSSLEAFDFRGRDRIDDDRPHFKWINRVFMFRNIYLNFGADDFISKDNANAFVGAGIRFGDDDIKYFISRLGLTSGAS